MFSGLLTNYLGGYKRKEVRQNEAKCWLFDSEENSEERIEREQLNISEL